METRKSLQNKLFHDSIEDALTTDVLAAGGYKKVGHHLKPDRTPEQAAAWLRACLNVEREETLKPSQVMEIKRLAKESNSTATIDYEAQQLSYRVEWVEPENELKELLARYLDSQELQGAMRERIEKLIQRTQLKVVSR